MSQGVKKKSWKKSLIFILITYYTTATSYLLLQGERGVETPIFFACTIYAGRVAKSHNEISLYFKNMTIHMINIAPVSQFEGLFGQTSS